MLNDNVDMVIGSTEDLKTDKSTHIMPVDALGVNAYRWRPAHEKQHGDPKQGVTQARAANGAQDRQE